MSTLDYLSQYEFKPLPKSMYQIKQETLKSRYNRQVKLGVIPPTDTINAQIHEQAYTRNIISSAKSGHGNGFNELKNLITKKQQIQLEKYGKDLEIEKIKDSEERMRVVRSFKPNFFTTDVVAKQKRAKREDDEKRKEKQKRVMKNKGDGGNKSIGKKTKGNYYLKTTLKLG